MESSRYVIDFKSIATSIDCCFSLNMLYFSVGNSFCKFANTKIMTKLQKFVYYHVILCHLFFVKTMLLIDFQIAFVWICPPLM